MAKIKHSLLKNGLQLFCYKNVLNDSMYSKYDNIESSENEIDELIDIENNRKKIDIKRKLVLTSSSSSILKPISTIDNKKSSTSTANNNKQMNFNVDNNQPKKKLQNIYIHYTGNSLNELTSSSKQTNSPKSPVSKLAKKNECNHQINDENISLMKTDGDNSIKNDDLSKRKNKEKIKRNSNKLGRSKSSINSSKLTIDNNYCNRARILSPIPALSAMVNDKENINIHHASVKSAPPNLRSQSIIKPQSNINRLSYPPDSAQTNTSSTQLQYRSSYSIIPSSRSPLAMKQQQHQNEIKTSPKNIKHHLKTLTRTTSSPIKEIEFEIRLNNNNENQLSTWYQNSTINGVKLRKSRSSNNDKTAKQRSLSAVSTVSTKKSVRFADSVGLELENIFNLSSNNTNTDSNKISLFLDNNNNNNNNNTEPNFYQNFSTKESFDNNNRRKIHSDVNSNNKTNNQISLFISPSNDDNVIKNDYLYLNKLKSNNSPINQNTKNNNNNNNNFVKTLKLANLTVRTRINNNGKLESEV